MEGQLLEVVVFEIGGQHYGLPASDVRELLRAVAAPLLGVVVNQVRRRATYQGHRYAPYVRMTRRNQAEAEGTTPDDVVESLLAATPETD